MEGQDVGAFATASRPVCGLGNFKGVMLCNRPVDDPSAKMASDDPGPFRSMIAPTHGEMVGLTPARSYEPTVKKRGPSAALRRHVRWLKELQDQMKDEREQVEGEEAEDVERKRKMKAVFEKHRDAVRDMIQERAKDWVDPSRDPEKHKMLQEERARKKADKARSKPLWAMTAQEKESFEEGEADDLINFAENLDFEKYVGDLDFREGLDALKDRAGKLAKERDAFKDALVRDFNMKLGDDLEERSTSAGGSVDIEDGLEGASLFGDLVSEGGTRRRRRRRGEERYGSDGRPDWDNSTNAGDDIDVEKDRDLKDAADMILESNSQMRAIHSKDSVQRIIEKTRKNLEERPPVDIHEAMARDGPAPAPVIVTSQDTQNRLYKPVDPSQLPYLYRSPAI